MRPARPGLSQRTDGFGGKNEDGASHQERGTEPARHGGEGLPAGGGLALQYGRDIGTGGEVCAHGPALTPLPIHDSPRRAAAC